MPEQLTKHPEVTLEVLRSASGARCGEGAPQAILKACPAERFCALPGGEICVYGLADAQRMTQITPAELIAAAGAPALPSSAPAPRAGDAGLGGALGGAFVGIVAGAVLTALALRRRR